MKRIICTSFLLLLALVQISYGQVLTEQFDYTPGSTLDSNGWTSHSGSSSPISVDANSLTFNQYAQTPIGGSAVSAGTSQDVNRTFGAISSGDVYASFLLKLDTINGSSYFFHFMDAAGTTAWRARTFFRQDADNANAFNLGLHFNSTTAVFDTTEFMYGSTILIVAKYSIISGTNNDEVRLYAFDSSTGSIANEPASPLIGPITASGTQSDIAPARIALRQFTNNGGNAGYTVDAFSVDTVWNMAPFGPSGPASPYCNTQVYHFQDPTQAASSVFLTITSISPSALEVVVESATADPVNNIVIAGAAGGGVPSAIDSSMPGKYRRTLTWQNVAPANAAFNVLWGKRNTPGLWQLEPGAGQLNWVTASTCNGGSPLPPPLAQIDIPITWDDTTTVDYTVTDFGGATTSMLAVDPSNASNSVLMTTKGTTGQLWSGTTLSTPNGLANAIPFAVGQTTMKALVYAPDTGITVRLKVEDKTSSGAINVEIDAVTQVANAWDTLTFDFSSVNLSNTYDLVSIFYDFNNLPTTPAVYYVDDVWLEAQSGPLTSPYCNTQVYHLSDPNQTTSSAFLTITNNGGNAVDVIIESADANAIKDLVIAGGSGAAISAIDSSIAGQYKRTLSWATNTPDTADFNVLWGKRTFPGLWQLIPAPNQLAFPVAATCGGTPPPMKAPIDLPITWDDTANVDYTVTDFGGATTSTLAADPSNSSNTVLMTIKDTVGQPWSGTTLNPAGGSLANPIPFAAGSTTIKALVYAPDTGLTVRLKVEDVANNTIFVEVDATTQVANAWDTLSFDMSAANFSNTYNVVSIFYNFLVTPAVPQTFYLDDVYLESTSGPMKAQIDLPITWDDTANVNYDVTDFGGASSMLVADPTNASNLVLSSLKDTAMGVMPWAGTTLSTSNGLANAIPFTSTATTISAAIYSPDANITIRLKAEDASDNTIFVEAEAMTTVANAWDTLIFNFANNVTGPTLDTSQTYDLLSIFYNFNVASPTPKTYYVDDIFFGGSGGPTLVQIDLPITWDDPLVNYTVGDFGGNASSRVADPTNASNMVLRSEKTSGSVVFAGTVLGTGAGLANPVPFTSTATTVSAVVYSPRAGVPVRMKIENSTNAGVFVETGTLTTVSNQWDTLVFDFSATIGPGLDTSLVYDKPIIFYDFGSTGLTPAEVYYLDDVFFGGTPGIVPSNVTFQVDMNGYSGSFTQPEINGTFNGFCGTCNPLVDPDGDNIWETTVTLLAAEIEYLFTHDNFTGIESFSKTNPPACTKSTISPPDTFVNRFLVLSGDTVLPPVCWESCSPCSGPPANSNITFQVDMSNYVGSYGQVNLNGTFNGFCGTCAVMTDANNDSIFEITVTVPNDTIEYLFTLDGFNDAESFDPGDPCTLTTITPTDTFVNRYFVPMGDTTLPVVCWESCSACSGIGIDENNWINDVIVAPNPTNGLFNVSANLAATSTITVEVVDLHGSIVYRSENNGTQLNESIDLSNHASGMYMIRITSSFGVNTYKLVKTR